MKKLPIGIQTLSKIIENNCIYIDKTAYAVQLITNYNCVFLSRPRRFGKSLFVDTLKEMFQGNRPLFAGLAAETKYDWSKTYPVINLCIAQGEFDTEERMRESLLSQLEENEQSLGVPAVEKSIAIRFRKLIQNASQKYNSKVVILIDEYDKPIISNINNPEMIGKAKTLLHSFYETIKNSDAFIHFTFITGVSRFARVSIFSGLNNLTDISLHKDYGTICGYTEREMEENFAEYLPEVDRSMLKKWYDGYNFLSENVYNPFDILLFFDSYDFRSYWFETGTPNMLIEMIKKERYFLPKLSGISAGEELLTSFDIDNINLITMLFQTGYLTIKKVEKIGITREYILDFPNLEVKAALNNSLLAVFSIDPQKKISLQTGAYKALYAGDMEMFRTTVEALFAAIPYHNYRKNEIARYEGFYASVIYAWLASAGLSVEVEKCTNKGRIDMTIEFEKRIYLIEFKVDAEGKALSQIKERGYAEKYQDKGKEIILIGISFNSKERNVSEFIWEDAGKS